MAKPKVASDWLAGCAGCHMSFLGDGREVGAKMRPAENPGYPWRHYCAVFGGDPCAQYEWEAPQTRLSASFG